MWTGDEEKVFQGVVDHYNRIQGKVYLQNLGSVPDDKILRAITAGAPPDFFTLREPGYLAPLAANGALLPLDDWFREAGFREADFVPGALELGRYNGKLYSMPYLLDAMALFYNPDHFRRAGLPPTAPRDAGADAGVRASADRARARGRNPHAGAAPARPDLHHRRVRGAVY
jgi:ABC-type glycerol-3-phosphate transport system substrate-binding protein